MPNDTSNARAFLFENNIGTTVILNMTIIYFTNGCQSIVSYNPQKSYLLFLCLFFFNQNGFVKNRLYLNSYQQS